MLKSYIQECKALQEKFSQKNPTQKLITNCQNTLNPNDYTLSFFENLEQKSTEPMQIAIVGQFSSGKSTFLNALLGQDILPTGITPITSKVCKICYGEDYILEILYKDGRKVLQNVEFLHKLTRENSKNIDHFCLYAPILLLKEINFLDTPGFNSQNSDDTHATLKVLEQVDGIIWLTLIDNAGKNSEKALLKEFSAHFAQKSLCVLNQKDRLKNEIEIQTSVEYAKIAFDGIFANVIPISAKLALKARLNTTEKFLETSLLSLAHSIQDIALKRTESALSPKESLQKLQELYVSTQEKINTQCSNQKDFEALMQDSNMPLIFEFLNQTIKPKASFAKAHSALKRLKEMHIHLHLQYHKINQSYKNLQKILRQSNAEFVQSCTTSKAKEQKIFNALYLNLDVLLDSLAQKIFNALEKQHIIFYKDTKTLLGTKSKAQVKEVTILPLEKIKIALQNQDTQLVKDYKAISIKIKNFLELFVDSIHQNTNTLSQKIFLWQDFTPKSLELYLIAPQSQALQDLYHFTQHCYENILADFNKDALVATSFLHSELNVLSNFLSLNYNNAIDLTLTRLDLRIKNAIAKHQENQEEFALFNPTLENVREALNDAFCFEQFQARLFGPMNSLNKAYAQFLEQSKQTAESKTQLIAQTSFALKKEIDKITQNLKAIRAQTLTL
ncbi:dynamin family protein [Helicobacter turcicus]|uniref:Dynamin family protein n=1 Tax=Helicobacter turcicus TaxID=2867412 RepID=A0ABS7JN62_9HELI|nr:dynamin family protein [Helicobacter turcicus]MBX7490820.1 dynamin family protein [Helicobacter turcicus]MBX7545571.1 dynamin family protein [Helicobacter turcicus]